MSHSILINKFIDHQLRPEEALELAAWIKADPQNADLFAREMTVHDQIRGIIHQPTKAALRGPPPVSDVLAAPGGLLPIDFDLDDDLEAEPVLSFHESMFLPAIRLDDDDDEDEAAAALMARSADAANAVATEGSSANAARRAGMMRWAAWLGGLAASVLIVTFAAIAFSAHHPPVAIASGRQQTMLGSAAVSPAPWVVSPVVLAAVSDAVWKAGGEAPKVGAVLPGTVLELRSGLLQLTGARGETVIVRGPAKFDVGRSPDLTLYEGSLCAQVTSAARGFSVHTPAACVVDLGTEFGIDVSAGGETYIEVFKGTVEAQSTQSDGRVRAARRLNANEAASVSSRTGAVVLAAANPERFVRREEFAVLQRAASGTPYDRWALRRLQLHRESAVVAFYSFEPEASAPDRLSDESLGRQNYGVIHGAKRVEGRWPNKGGLAFSNRTEDVRLDLPEKCDEFSIETWVRLDETPNVLGAILNTDGIPEGFVHLQAREDGSVSFDVGTAVSVRSRTFVMEPGRWRQLVGVYSVAARTIALYVDGKLAAQAPVAAPRPARIGRARIGRWEDGGAPNTNPADRPFVGVIDDLVVWRKALSAAEIRAAYDAAMGT